MRLNKTRATAIAVYAIAFLRANRTSEQVEELDEKFGAPDDSDWENELQHAEWVLDYD